MRLLLLLYYLFTFWNDPKAINQHISQTHENRSSGFGTGITPEFWLINPHHYDILRFITAHKTHKGSIESIIIISAARLCNLSRTGFTADIIFRPEVAQPVN